MLRHFAKAAEGRQPFSPGKRWRGFLFHCAGRRVMMPAYA
jgi:hypothetical protein